MFTSLRIAKKIIDYLTTEGFLDRAKLPDRPTKPSVPPQGPTYVLSRWSDLSENLGWGLPMLQRLDGLRTVLDGEAAKKMDVLLERMAESGKHGKSLPPRNPASD